MHTGARAIRRAVTSRCLEPRAVRSRATELVMLLTEATMKQAPAGPERCRTLLSPHLVADLCHISGLSTGPR